MSKKGIGDLLDAPLVVGVGVTGAAVLDALVARGFRPRAADDHPSASAVRRAESVDVTLVAAPDETQWDALVSSSSVVLPSPGIPDHHPVFAAASRSGVPIASEFDLATSWDDRPMVAITGTNGKTTVTMMTTAVLRASGVHAVDAGNTDVPLVTAIDDAEAEVFVVEASSFRLGHSRAFRPLVATWVNFAPDHLDVHASLDAYEQAKARIWQDLRPGAVAVANADDPVVMRHAPPGETVTFGLDGVVGEAHWTVRDGYLVDPGGEEVLPTDRLWRTLPHDLADALAAAASAAAVGATPSGIASGLGEFSGLAHRVELVAQDGDVRYYDDSKATTPHAVVAAVSGFSSVVLIAGGKNKGIDLAPLAQVAERCRAVVAIGDAAGEVAAAFADRVPTHTAQTMSEAVASAHASARPGDVVLLSPGCASFDWYTSYGERGDDFAREVRSLLDPQSSPQHTDRS